jgi:signal peptidase II
MRYPTGSWFVANLVVAMVAFDQLSKLWVQQNLPIYSSLEIIPSFFQLSHYINQGAIGGIGWRSPVTIPLLVAGSALLSLLLVVIYRYYSSHTRPSWRMKLFLALSIAPLLSHATDRLRQGYVVDFLHFPGLPVFNFADLLPHVAFVLLAMEFVSQLRRRRRANAAPPAPTNLDYN